MKQLKPFLITLAFIIGAFLLIYVSYRMNKPVRVIDNSGCSTSLGQVSFAKDMKIDSAFQIGESHITTTDELTAMFLTLQQQTIDSLKNELALRDTTDWQFEHSKIK